MNWCVCFFCFSFIVINSFADFSLIPPEKFAQAASILDKTSGSSISGKNIISMGINRDSTGITLFVVTLDSTSNPVKESFIIDQAFIDAIEGQNEAPKQEELKRDEVVVIGDTVKQPAESADMKVDRLPHTSHKQDGRMYFMLSNSLVKVSYVVPTNLTLAFANIDENVISGITLLSIGGALYGTYEFTKNMELGWGRVAMMNYGGNLGIAYPAFVTWLLDRIIDGNATNNQSEIAYERREGKFPALKVNAALTLIGYPSGIYLGSRNMTYRNDQYGNVLLQSWFGLYSAIGYAAALPIYLPQRLTSKYYQDIFSGLSLALIPGMNYATWNVLRNHDFSSGRALFIVSTGILGAATGIAVPVVLGLYDSKTKFDELATARIQISSVLAANMLGTWFGYDFNKDIKYSFLQAVFIDASAAAGIAVAAGLMLITEPSDYKLPVAIVTVGAWAGLIAGERISYNIFENYSRDKRASAATISFPGLSSVPILALSHYFKKFSIETEKIDSATIPLVQIAF